MMLLNAFTILNQKPGLCYYKIMNTVNFTLATVITCARILLVPIFLYMATVDMRYAVGIFIAASLSDWFDGFIARKMSCQTDFGALLDPLADKAMSWAALLVINRSIHHPALLIASICIVARDAYLSAQRVYYYIKKCYPEQLGVSKTAKVKTALLFVSQVLLTFYLYAKNDLVYQVGLVLLYASCLLTLISFGLYLLRSKKIEL